MKVLVILSIFSCKFNLSLLLHLDEHKSLSHVLVSLDPGDRTPAGEVLLKG
jgi:hypothetical protein